ncbi:hypothetical protein PENSPDRAFT_747482 [Peniophora sp. CONT]|nr:hypothetical protein PENSPDRAFT_747482 [Peniophora sp. CONT]
MKFDASITALALAVIAFAAPVKRDLKSVQTGIMAISDQADALNNVIASFKASPSSLTAQPVTNDLTGLVGTVAAATADVVTSTAFTAGQSTKIVSSITALASHIDTALTSLEAQRSSFNADSLEPSIATTETSLLQLQSSLTSFENALAAKFAKKSIPAMDEAIDSINNVVTPAVNAFAS